MKYALSTLAGATALAISLIAGPATAQDGIVVYNAQHESLTQAWVLLALAGFVLAFLIGAIYLSRSAIQLERAANEMSDLPAAQVALGRWLGGYAVVLLVLAFVVWDMIFKPGI